MAYLPYRMYGNGNFHLPIIDIVQTINSAHSHVCKQSYPVVSSSSKGFSSLKRELEWRRRTGKSLRHFSERKSHSFNYLPRKLILIDEDRANNRNVVFSTSSKSKTFKIRKNAPQTSNRMLNYSCDKDCECLKENKSLKVLFRARRSNGSFDTDVVDEEELDLSFLKNPLEHSTELKRKGSFIDYIKIKRRKGTESYKSDSDSHQIPPSCCSSVDRIKGEDQGDAANM